MLSRLLNKKSVRFYFYFLGSSFLLLSYQNCSNSNINFTRDYQQLSSEMPPETPIVVINHGKATNQPKVPVEINIAILEKVVESKVLKMKFSIQKVNLHSLEWKDVANHFELDLGSEYSSLGNKDGIKKLHFAFLLENENAEIIQEYDFILDTIQPNFKKLNLSNGDNSTSKNFNIAQLNIEDKGSPIVSICLKQDSIRPEKSDGCWSALESEGIKKTKNLDVNNFPVLIGFISGTFTFFGFAMDEAGNISNIVDGVGVDGVNRKSISYIPPTPPVVTNVFAANTNLMLVPPLSEEMILNKKNVYIRWKISSSQDLITNPISIYYTKDEITYYKLRENLRNNSNGDCTFESNSTGCAVIDTSELPSTYLRIRVSAKDINGQIAMSSTAPLNTPNWRSLAGNTDAGLYGSSTTAMFFNNISYNQYSADPYSFVITNKGQIIFKDKIRGLLISDPKDGILKVLIPLSNKNTNGSLDEATTSGISAIALDYKGGVIISESNQIRRIDLEARTISTLIGGGNEVDHNTLSHQFNYSQCSSPCPLIPLPNGDLLFLSAYDQFNSLSGGARLRHYVASEKVVRAYQISGQGSFGDANFNINDSSQKLENFSVGYNEINSQITFLQLIFGKPVVGGRVFNYVTVNPSTFEIVSNDLQIRPAFNGGYNSDIYLTDRNGNPHAYSRLEAAILKLDKINKKWERILGTGSVGYCEDNTFANQCHIDLQSVFFGLQGRLFFADKGRIRVLNSDQTTYTISGQSFSFGDNGFATSARFGTIKSFDIDNNQNIVLLDTQENRIRRFKRRDIIRTIAGNGNHGKMTHGSNAISSSLYTSYWGASSNMVINPINNSVVTTSGSDIFELNQSNGLWVFKTNYKDTGYPTILLGANSKQIISANNSWSPNSGGYHLNCHISSFASTNYESYVLVGNLNQTPCAYPNENLNQNSIPFLDNFNDKQMMAIYIEQTDVWLSGMKNSNKIYQFNGEKNGTFKIKTILPENASSFTFVKNLIQGEMIYFCSTNNQQIKIYNITTGILTTPKWPSPTIQCSGNVIKFDSNNNKIIFPYTQNNLEGIAEMDL